MVLKVRTLILEIYLLKLPRPLRISHSSIAKYTLCENQQYEIFEQQLLSEGHLDIMELAETDLSVESHTQHGIVQIGVHQAYKGRDATTPGGPVGSLWPLDSFNRKHPFQHTSKGVQKKSRKVKLLLLTPMERGIFYDR